MAARKSHPILFFVMEHKTAIGAVFYTGATVVAVKVVEAISLKLFRLMVK